MMTIGKQSFRQKGSGFESLSQTMNFLSVCCCCCCCLFVVCLFVVVLKFPVMVLLRREVRNQLGGHLSANKD